MKVCSMFISEDMPDPAAPRILAENNGQDSDYWHQVEKFLRDVWDRYYEDLSYKQRGWINQILSRTRGL